MAATKKAHMSITTDLRALADRIDAGEVKVDSADRPGGCEASDDSEPGLEWVQKLAVSTGGVFVRVYERSPKRRVNDA